MDPFIRLENVSKLYGGNGVRAAALRGVSLSIEAGEYAAITGESGAGKSTLLTILGGLQVPSSGTVLMKGVDLSSLSSDRLADFRRETIGIIFQAYHLLPDPCVLLADEPTGNLDSVTGEHILDLFSGLHKTGKTVLMVTHNRGNLSRATRLIRLRDGIVAEDAPLLAPRRAP